MSILIVDDNRDGADSLALLLRLWGYEVDVAYNGVQGLRRARELKPAVAFVDLVMTPAMSGWHFAAAIRSEAALAQTVLIAVSGYGRTEDRQRSREAGFHYHLLKPADPGYLHALLDRLVPAATPQAAAC